MVCQSSAYSRNALRSLIEQDTALSETQRDKETKKRIRKAEKRIAELELLMKRLYEDYALGKISEERFDQLAPAYEAEQASLKEGLAADREQQSRQHTETERIDRFLELAERYRGCTVITDEMIRAFIEKIVVHHPATDGQGQRIRQIDIYFSFIGRIDLSGHDPNTDDNSTT